MDNGKVQTTTVGRPSYSKTVKIYFPCNDFEINVSHKNDYLFKGKLHYFFLITEFLSKAFLVL